MTASQTSFSVRADAIVKGKVPKDPREAQFILRLRGRGRHQDEMHYINVVFENAGFSNEVVSASCTTRNIPDWFMALATVMIKHGIIVMELDRTGPCVAWYQLERLS